MIKNYLILGEPEYGKSTYLLNLLKSVMVYAGGYRTLRISDKTGRVTGFCHVRADFPLDPVNPEDWGLPADSKVIDGVSIETEGRVINQFLEIGESLVYHNEVFREFTLPLIKQKNRSFIFMDEIGGTELEEADIFNAYLEVFNSDVPCIGILKSDRHAKGFSYDRYQELKQLLMMREGTVIRQFTKDREILTDEKERDEEFFNRILSVKR